MNLVLFQYWLNCSTRLIFRIGSFIPSCKVSALRLVVFNSSSFKTLVGWGVTVTTTHASTTMPLLVMQVLLLH